MLSARLPRDQRNCGLLAAAPVRHFLGNEPQIAKRVRSFIRGELERDYFDVAVAPRWIGRRRRGQLMLPLVRFKLKMVQRVDGWFCEVTCSDEDMELVVDAERARVASDSSEVDIMRRYLAETTN